MSSADHRVSRKPLSDALIMAARKKPVIATANTALYWVLAAVLAFSIGVPLVAGALLRFIL
jgi:hypothetical protein